jgi:hypothetical protein
MLDELKYWLETGNGAVDRRLEDDNRGVLSEVRLIGGGLIMVLIILLVLTEVWNAISPEPNGTGGYNGTFGDVYESVETTGSAGLTLLVVGFLVVAATAIMRFFGGMGGGR